MDLTPEQCYEVIRTRDRRFDGRLFVGVRSTRVYCRPICTSKRPAFKQCEFFKHAVLAEIRGFRPCLRCRPELAPGNAPVDRTERVCDALLRQIDLGIFREATVREVAAQLGISDRQLRRITLEQFGVAPVVLAQTQRLLLAKQLLMDTSLPISQVALASGFSSLRRFNTVFRERYRLTPRLIRRGNKRKDPFVTCRLGYRAPFDWDGLLEFLRSRSLSGVELIEGGTYSRTVGVGHHRGWIAVENDPEVCELRVKVSTGLVPALGAVVTRVRRLFDLDADPELIDERLGEIARGHPGLRVAGAFDGFEMALRAIVGQQISVKAATTMVARITQSFGEAIETERAELNRLAPTAQRIGSLSEQDLSSLGMIRARARTIIALAQAVASGKIHLDMSASVPKTIGQLTELPGIGEWTAHYFAMRALRWPDAFPHSDLGILKALQTTKPKQALRIAEQWRPWRSYAAMHLWKSRSEKK